MSKYLLIFVLIMNIACSFYCDATGNKKQGPAMALLRSSVESKSRIPRSVENNNIFAPILTAIDATALPIKSVLKSTFNRFVSVAWHLIKNYVLPLLDDSITVSRKSNLMPEFILKYLVQLQTAYHILKLFHII
ncbi:uncharacterized protein LOC106646525 [Copidosoma floridanum]|uniref:uncharacterized protein LOC106646525 n=1 Tax=Copidosoma floridanum TaxID=29053 RepID=UPI0006C9E303|nr:uncharacterized protein LOC106646525 [Copidosoma floridanum]